MNRTCENLANPQKKNLKLRRRRFLIIIKNLDLNLRSSVLKMQQHGKFLFFFHGKSCIDLSSGKIQQLMPTLKHLIRR